MELTPLIESSAPKTRRFPSTNSETVLRLLRGTDLRRLYRSCRTHEFDHPEPTGISLDRDGLPVVRQPHVARLIDTHAREPSHCVTRIARGRRNRVAGVIMIVTIFGSRAAQLSDVFAYPIGNPHVVVAVERDAPRPIDSSAGIWTSMKGIAVFVHRHHGARQAMELSANVVDREPLGRVAGTVAIVPVLTSTMFLTVAQEFCNPGDFPPMLSLFMDCAIAHAVAIVVNSFTTTLLPPAALNTAAGSTTAAGPPGVTYITVPAAGGRKQC